MVLWIVAVSGWVLAVVAYLMVRRQGRKVAELTDMYWQLKYDHGALRAEVAPAPVAEAAAAPVKQTFVPLSQLKR